MEFRVGTAEDVPADVADVVVSGLVLNFVPDAAAAVSAMVAAAPGGTVAAYVWDYAGRMQFLRTFWDVACALDVAAIDLDEGQRFPLCEPHALTDLWERGRTDAVSTASIEVTTEFADFDDLWSPFLGGDRRRAGVRRDTGRREPGAAARRPRADGAPRPRRPHPDARPGVGGARTGRLRTAQVRCWAPCRCTASSTAASRAAAVSVSVRVRSGARKRSAKASDLRPSPTCWPV